MDEGRRQKNFTKDILFKQNHDGEQFPF